MIPPFELMLNDLVVGQTPFTSPFQIAAISGTQVAGYTTDLNFAKVEMNINNLLPLPVTPAFLANNGWRVAPGGYMVIDMTNPDTNIKTRFAWHESGEFIIGYGRFPARVQYIHHWQNGMRDCGLINYANNIQYQSL